ncbi:MAG TPA: histidine phosphatase family protein, partial [Oscillospiraceae bacterium]|nr:histidine phosphatase family protein [Oscillospiraceae bacterium]
TVRSPARLGLDLGCGSGYQALRLAMHCERVIATDINERCLNFTQMTMALNGVTNVDVRLGSLFEPVEGLRECDLGAFEGRPFAELNREEAFLLWLEGKAPPPGGETFEELGRRVTEAFEYILSDMMRRRIIEAAAVTHGAIVMGLLSMYGYPKAEMREWAVENGCGYTVRTSAAMWMRDRCFEVVSAVPSAARETEEEGEEEIWNLEER